MRAAVVLMPAIALKIGKFYQNGGMQHTHHLRNITQQGFISTATGGIQIATACKSFANLSYPTTKDHHHWQPCTNNLALIKMFLLVSIKICQMILQLLHKPRKSAIAKALKSTAPLPLNRSNNSLRTVQQPHSKSSTILNTQLLLTKTAAITSVTAEKFVSVDICKNNEITKLELLKDGALFTNKKMDDKQDELGEVIYDTVGKSNFIKPPHTHLWVNVVAQQRENQNPILITISTTAAVR